MHPMTCYRFKAVLGKVSFTGVFSLTDGSWCTYMKPRNVFGTAPGGWF